MTVIPKWASERKSQERDRCSVRSAQVTPRKPRPLILTINRCDERSNCDNKGSVRLVPVTFTSLYLKIPLQTDVESIKPTNFAVAVAHEDK